MLLGPLKRLPTMFKGLFVGKDMISWGKDIGTLVSDWLNPDVPLVVLELLLLLMGIEDMSWG